MQTRKKRILYKTAKLAASIAILPVMILYKIETWLLNTEEPFVGASQFLSLIPGLFGNLMRLCFYEKTLKKIGPNSSIFFGTIITHCTAQIGDYVFIATNCTIGTATIGDNVLISSNVDIISGRHQHGAADANKPMREQGTSLRMIFIGDDSWIGNSAVIMANIGKHCIIGAGSVVVHDIPDYSVAVGNPARVIRTREKTEV